MNKSKLDDKLSLEELAQVLHIISSENNTTLPALLRKLDKVSGNLNHLNETFKGDKTLEWT